MVAGIHFEKVWFDDDLVQLQVSTSDASSTFVTRLYVGHQELEKEISGLMTFKDQVHGGLYDLRFGEFGHEYAAGAFQARLHFIIHSKLHVTVNAQSDFETFGIKKVASEAALYLVSEPVLLDRFIVELRQLHGGIRNDATLVCPE